jgi:hypothetical protein
LDREYRFLKINPKSGSEIISGTANSRVLTKNMERTKKLLLVVIASSRVGTEKPISEFTKALFSSRKFLQNFSRFSITSNL